MSGTSRRCKRDAIGRSKLCKAHQSKADYQKQSVLDGNGKVSRRRTPSPNYVDPPGVDYEDVQTVATLGGTGSSVVKQQRRALATFVINEQSRAALQKLGKTDASADPRQTLLDTVASAHRQRIVWEQMLAAIPEDDWQYVGIVPVPGSQLSSRGARIEAIQKHLADATKAAARISKLAIDAGIEERLVRLAEEQSAMIADTVRAGIMAALASLVRELRLSSVQSARVLDEALSSAATHLRLLATGVDPDSANATNATEADTPAHEFDQPLSRVERAQQARRAASARPIAATERTLEPEEV